jgi:hypothetical protein
MHLLCLSVRRLAPILIASEKRVALNLHVKCIFLPIIIFLPCLALLYLLVSRKILFIHL